MEEIDLGVASRKQYENRVPPPDPRRFSFTRRTQVEKDLYSQHMRVERYKNLATARAILSDTTRKHRTRNCSITNSWSRDATGVMRPNPIEIYTTKEGNHSHFKGLNVCGSVWACPVCAPKIGGYRSKELTEAVKKINLSVKFAVNTLQHNRGSELKTLNADLIGGVSFMLSGATAKRFYKKWSIVGTITGLDYTFGLANGHHPHKNILFFSTRPQADLDSDEFEADLDNLEARYCRSISSKGYQIIEGITFKTTRTPKDGDTDQVIKYITKWATEDEITQGQSKEAHPGHYTPFQLLAAIRDKSTSEEDQAAYIKAFREYADAFKGRRQLVYSKGLRQLLGLNVKESTDQEVAEAGEEPSTLFATLTWSQYRQVLRFEKRGELGVILNIAATGNIKLFWDHMTRLGAPPSDTQLLAMLAITGDVGHV